MATPEDMRANAEFIRLADEVRVFAWFLRIGDLFFPKLPFFVPMLKSGS
jgi:hypothetical protein